MSAATPLFLTEGDVAALVTMEDALAATEQAFRAWGAPATENLPRQRAALEKGSFNLMGASFGPADVFGLKAYYAGGRAQVYHVALYSRAEARLVALIEANLLSQLRTGAASGVATRLLAREDAATLAVIGSGKQAFAQVEAVRAVRPIRRLRVHSPTPERREAFAERVATELGLDAAACGTAEEALAGAEVVVTITKAAAPVCRSAWVADGAHINAAGANARNRREIAADLVDRAALLATDDPVQARTEAAEFIDAADRGARSWAEIHALGDILGGRAPSRRSADELTLFKSLGVGLEDVAFADLVYRRALERGLGRPIG